MNNFEFEFFRGNISPVLIYNTWDDMSQKAYDAFVQKYNPDNAVDIFEFPEIVSLQWLPKVIDKCPCLIFINDRKNTNDPARITVMDVPSQIMHTLTK
jgi:hypothetical protein